MEKIDKEKLAKEFVKEWEMQEKGHSYLRPSSFRVFVIKLIDQQLVSFYDYTGSYAILDRARSSPVFWADDSLEVVFSDLEFAKLVYEYLTRNLPHKSFGLHQRIA